MSPNIFLLFLFFNLFILFEQINCECIKEAYNFCTGKNKCCPGLTCANNAAGTSFCIKQKCIKKDAECDVGKNQFCCPGLFCSFDQRCETCLQDGEYCGLGIYNFKCCKNNCGKISGICGKP
ncbi:unnamed protein product [Meloidogyne enterolobii]|uniref:Uncharacterized protein n=1 Tax=Meloidogyne enterolobii TaxID=390850 RepID=A0ACB0YMJ9_MELEN